MKLYPLYLDIGSYEDQRYILLGVFDTKEKAISKKRRLEKVVKKQLESGLPDGITYDEDNYPVDETSKEDMERFFRWCNQKHDLEEINRLYVDNPIDLNKLTFGYNLNKILEIE